MPKLTLKGQNDTCSDISKFDWQDTTIVEEIASRTFGNVYLATQSGNKQAGCGKTTARPEPARKPASVSKRGSPAAES